MSNNDDCWVFAYGSLMWHADFPHAEARPAKLYGYHRTLCLWSFDYRGTPEKPGLVLGLDRGGSCRGMAFRIETKDREAAMSHLMARETSKGEYHLRWLKLIIENEPCAITGAAFVVNHANVHYAGPQSPEAAARLVTQGHGRRGPCLDYLKNTVTHLQQMGIHDRALEQVLRAAEK